MPKKPAKPAKKSATKKSATARKPTPKKAARPTLAERADKHALYQVSVQSPGVDIEFFEEQFTKYRGRKPLKMREDFCGTALMSTVWCQSDPERTALGVDLDGPTLAYGREHNIDPAGPDVAKRVKLAQADVRETRFAKVDLTLAMNFSYCVFHTRDQLGEYFTAACTGLVRDGMLALEVYGGTESMSILEEERAVRGATYIWEQAKFDAFSHDFQCYIHFMFPDGSKIYRAFSYDWRLWMAPELRDILLEAGFSKVHFYWEKTDAKGEGTGVFYEPDYVENQEIWWTYLAAER
jgi:hypothetical protein